VTPRFTRLIAPLVALGALATTAGTACGAMIGVDMADTMSVAQRQRWEDAGGQAAIARALEEELARSGWIGATAAARLEVTLTGYRMRPGTAPPWLVYGVIPPYRIDPLGDGDTIGVLVTVRDDDRIIDAYQVEARVPDQPGPRDPKTRAARLARAAARRVATTLADRKPAG